jgi:hypothetical protein
MGFYRENGKLNILRNYRVGANEAMDALRRASMYQRGCNSQLESGASVGAEKTCYIAYTTEALSAFYLATVIDSFIDAYGERIDGSRAHISNFPHLPMF